MLATFLILNFPISDAGFLPLTPLLPHPGEGLGFLHKPLPQCPLLDLLTASSRAGNQPLHPTLLFQQSIQGRQGT